MATQRIDSLVSGNGTTFAQTSFYGGQTFGKNDSENPFETLIGKIQYEEYLSRNATRVAGTCGWFLNHPTYVKWLKAEKSSLLWLSADPGCGKSVIARCLVEEELPQMAPESTICHFFFKDDNEMQKPVANALRSILHQIFKGNENLMHHFQKSLRQNGSRMLDSSQLLWNILLQLAQDPGAGQIICIIDALDESIPSDQSWLMRKLHAYYDPKVPKSQRAELKFLVTSRGYHNIETGFRLLELDAQSICGEQIRLSGEDESEAISQEIQLVMESKVNDLERIQKLDPNTKTRLLDKLGAVPHRTHLWFALVYDMLEARLRSLTKNEVETISDNIPDSLEKAYDAILNKSPDPKQAMKLLHIICAAKTTFTVSDMRVAMAIEKPFQRMGHLELQSSATASTFFRNICGLFISIIQDHIYLIHLTAKAFLMSNESLQEPDNKFASPRTWKHSVEPRKMNLIMSEICMRGLLMDNIGDNHEATKAISKFVKTYAEYHWRIHYKLAKVKAESEVSQLALSLCSQKANNWQTEWNSPIRYNFELKASPTVLDVLIYEEFDDLIRQCLNKGMLDDPKTRESAILSSAACENLPLVEHILRLGVDVNTKAEEDNTPIHIASGMCNSKILAALLSSQPLENGLIQADDRSEANCPQSNEKASCGISSPDINALDTLGRTPLIYCIIASVFEYEIYCPVVLVNQDACNTTLRLLLDAGANVNLIDKDQRSPISYAAQHLIMDEVALLLEFGADPNLEDESGRTPLSYAVEQSYDSVRICKLLLEFGADPNLADESGRTPFSYAVEQSGNSIRIWKLLLEFGADPNLADESGRTPLLYAVEQSDNSVRICKLLLEFGADPNVKDHLGHDLLWHAREVPSFGGIIEELISVFNGGQKQCSGARESAKRSREEAEWDNSGDDNNASYKRIT